MTYRNDALVGTYDDGIAVLAFQMEGRANKINETFVQGLVDGLAWANDHEDLAGIVLTSNHKDFCVGADLDWVYTERDPQAVFDRAMAFHRIHRGMETGKPIVAALTGSALGGGYEMALACHHRVALDSPKVMVGCPEVNLGLIPGGGACQRLPRLIGLQDALEVIAQGQSIRAPKALKKGMVEELGADRDDVIAKAKAWIRANPNAKQPWESKSFRWPGVRPGSPDARNLFLAGSAMLYKKTTGAFPAAEAAFSVIQEGSILTFERSLEVEARAFAGLVVSDQAKDMIRTFFFHRTAAEKQVGLPKVDDHGFRRIAILGAGMMGAGLAFISAKAGFDVVLKDISDEAIAKGMAHIEGQLKKAPYLDAETILGRITATTELGAIDGCDLVIEAVFEDKGLKHRVNAETEPLLAANAVWASNTSALPITDLAQSSKHADRFIGLHFFSPVEKMPLLEIICGAETSDETLARALAYARAIRKTVIVVNDGYGFYTSRTFSSYILEGVQLVAEGHDPVLIEWAAKTQGMVVPPLQVLDEVSLKLAVHAGQSGEEYRGSSGLAAVGFMRDMVEKAERLGKAYGGGFYDYKDGRRKGLWSGLREMQPAEAPAETGVAFLARRLMLAQVAEVARCLDEGVLREYRDAEVGAIFGIGFAPNTGGPLAWMDRQGIPELVAELDRTADAYGERFRPAQRLRDMAAKGERFFTE